MSAPNHNPGDTYQKYYDRDILSIQSALDQYQEYKTEYRNLQTTLLELPDELEYDAMIPVGPLAFFPGKLIHTNEILVSLGDNWFTERSAKQAAAIAKRREEYVDEKIRESRYEMKELGERKKLVPEIFADEKEQVEKAMFNEDGEEIVDIMEELSAEQTPDFYEQTSDEGALSAEDVLAQRAKKALEAKRARVIQSLSESPSLAKSMDNKPLGAEEQRIIDLLNQFDSDDEGADEEASDNGHQSESDEDGDAFSDEDRANAARDDDEDDYNDYGRQQRGHFRRHRGDSSGDDDGSIGGDAKLNVVERHRRPMMSSPPPELDDSHKGILKQSTPMSLFKKRADEASSSGKGTPKSVSFNSTAVAYTRPSQDLLDESNVDEDINRVTNLISMIGMSSQDKGKAAVSPKIAIIDELPTASFPSSKAASAPPVVGKFKPNVSNAGVRSRGPSSSASKPPKAQQPMKSAVVERSAVVGETSQETVDEEMHAREIAQAYNRMRFVKLASGKLDEAADVAERILADTPGVTLIDSKAPMDDADEDDKVASGEYVRIELPEEPSPFSSRSVGDRPPEVVHQPRQPPPPPAAAQSSELEQQPTAKPKISRFKAQRLGLDG
ncbi:hypothetical protein GGI20_003399 [Coemansia sp. BCRC 34301]|nr:hypothetical protein GGI20_003399 [Coemansia sp. BCRC 34301]